MVTQLARAVLMASVMFGSMMLLVGGVGGALMAASVPLLAGSVNVMAGLAYRATIVTLAVAAAFQVMPAEWSGAIVEFAQDAVSVAHAGQCEVAAALDRDGTVGSHFLGLR